VSYVKWGSNLQLGVPFIDSDHRVLVRLLNQVHDCINDNEETTVLGSVIASLADYTNFHFQREERFQEFSDYSSLAQHQQSHIQFAEKVVAYKTGFFADPQNFSAGELLDFLSTWLKEHILGEDAELCGKCAGNERAIIAATDITLGTSDLIDWSSKKILVVDDNPNFQRLLTTILKAGGIVNIQVASDPYSALDKLARRPVDVILSDVLMDGMNGGQLASAAFKINPKIKVIFVSGLDKDGVWKQTNGVSGDAILEKPITPHALFKTIATVLINAAPTVPSDWPQKAANF